MSENCPYCESPELVLAVDVGRFSIACRRCHACGPSGATEEEALDRWNFRPTVAAVRNTLAAAAAENAALRHKLHLIRVALEGK